MFPRWMLQNAKVFRVPVPRLDPARSRTNRQKCMLGRKLYPSKVITCSLREYSSEASEMTEVGAQSSFRALKAREERCSDQPASRAITIR